MNENDNVTQLPRRTLSASNYNTPITNQANVAMRLHETYGREAHDRVWESELNEWEDRAREYVDLVYGDHYGTRWIFDAGSLDSARANHPAGRGLANGERPRPVHESIVRITPPDIDSTPYLDQVSAQHPSPTPLAGLIRFVGGEK